MKENDHIYIIAEAGVNHNGDYDLACKMIDTAADCGADAIKFQTFKAEKLVSASAKKVKYQQQLTDSDESQLKMLKELELSENDFTRLKSHCDSRGIDFLSTPFDTDSVDFLEDLVTVFKIPSGELTNLPFLEYVAGKQKEIILSTGMGTLGEVEEAVNVIRKKNDRNLVLLHCTSNYPTAFEDVNLRCMETMRRAFRLPAGYSDHTPGIEVSIAAAALGAVVIEKHFTMDRSLPGPDHKASLVPDELKAMVDSVRHIEQAMGTGIKAPRPDEMEVLKSVRKSLVSARDIKPGEIIQRADIELKRPATGIAPSFLSLITGKKIVKDLKQDEIITWEHFLE